MERWPEFILILAGGLAAVSIILWFALGIRQVTGELSGRTARRKIREMQKRQPELQRTNRQIVRSRQNSERREEQKTEILDMRKGTQSERQHEQRTEILTRRGQPESERQYEQRTEILTRRGQPESERQYEQRTEILIRRGQPESGHWNGQNTEVLASGYSSGVDNKTEILGDAGRLSLSQQRSERRKDE